MTLIDTNWLGYLAACLTTGSFVPQAWQTFRSDNLAGISVSMYSAFTAGVALWLLYGVALGEWPIIIANLVTLALASVIPGAHGAGTACAPRPAGGLAGGQAGQNGRDASRDWAWAPSRWWPG